MEPVETESGESESEGEESPAMEHKILEICVDNVESIRCAIEGGADRLELCSALTEGGLTPSPGLCSLAKRHCGERIKIYAMIRLRGGNFVYDPEEIDAMVKDVEVLKAIVDGFVFGALTKENKVDLEACALIIKAARPLHRVTFHRAFDEVDDPLKAVHQVASLGFERILTSGQKPTAVEGASLIAQLISLNENIVIMPGSGVNEDNLVDLVRKTGAAEYHGSAKAGEISYPESGVRPLTLTDAARVRKMKQILKDFTV